MYKTLLINILMLISFLSQAQKNDTKQVLASWYNIENFFDIVNDPKTNDDEFTPDGKNEWTAERYQKKLKNITRVFNEMGKPAIIGVCEIENKSVVEDIAKTLGENNYSAVHYDSPDERGIDVAFIYDKNFVKVTSSEKITVQLTNSKTKKPDYTRDILHVNAKVNGKTIHFYLNHWPSRREGQKESDEKRVFAATQLMKNIEKVQSKNSNEQIIIMGDLNDYFDNNSIKTVLKASIVNDKTEAKSLYDITQPLLAEGKGTYNFKGKWDMLDHVITTGNLCGKQNKVWISDVDIFKADFMLYFDKKEKENLPSRTYGGSYYFGGYSDHLPISFKLNFN